MVNTLRRIRGGFATTTASLVLACSSGPAPASAPGTTSSEATPSGGAATPAPSGTTERAPVASEDAATAATPPSGASPGDAGTSTDAAPAVAASEAVYNGPPPWLNVRPPIVGAGLFADAVRRSVSRTEPEIVRCYTRVLAADARAHGVLTVRLNVIAGGVAEVERVRLAPRNQDLETCVQGAIERSEWPAPNNVPSTGVTVTIDLAPHAPAGGARAPAR